jgi:hypothetical protein
MADEQEPQHDTEPQRAAAGGESYSAADLEHLSDLEHVRERPAMYIGDTTARGLHHLVFEVVDNDRERVDQRRRLRDGRGRWSRNSR